MRVQHAVGTPSKEHPRSGSGETVGDSGAADAASDRARARLALRPAFSTPPALTIGSRRAMHRFRSPISPSPWSGRKQ